MAEQSLTHFYLHCDSAHRELFSVIIREWQEAGLAWRISGDCLSLGKQSVSRDQRLNFFDLSPGEGIYSASIRLDMDCWRKTVGQEEMDRFLREMNSIDGVACKQHETTLSIDDPGHLSGPIQQQVRDQIKHFAYRLSDLIAA